MLAVSFLVVLARVALVVGFMASGVGLLVGIFWTIDYQPRWWGLWLAGFLSALVLVVSTFAWLGAGPLN